MYSLAQDPKIPVIRCIREKKSLLDPQKNGNLLWLACAYSQNTTAVIVQKTTCFFFARDIRQSFVHPNANSEALFWTSSAAAMSLFRNKKFALSEMFQRNASKFAIFYV